MAAIQLVSADRLCEDYRFFPDVRRTTIGEKQQLA
jgi:hypothetical protein